MSTVYVVMRGEYGQGGSVIAIASGPEAARRIVDAKVAKENREADEYRDEDRENQKLLDAGTGYEFDADEWAAEYDARRYWVEQETSRALACWDQGGDWMTIEAHTVLD